MDVRLSAEQQALRDSVAQVADRLGPRAVGAARRRASEPRSSTPPSPPRAGASCGPPKPATRPLGVGRRGGHRRRGARPRPGRRPVPRTDAGRRAAPPGRRPAGRRRPRRSPSPPASAGPAVVADGGSPAGARGRRRRRAQAPRSCWCPARTATRWARSPVRPASDPVDLTRPVGRRRARRPPRSPVGGQTRALTDDDLARWTALGLALTCADLVGVDARRGRAGLRLRRRSAPVRRRHRLVPGRPAPAGRCLRRRWRARGASPCTPPGRSTRSRPTTPLAAGAQWPRPTAPGRPATVCETAIQVHGGIGNTWECLAHVYLRRALLSSDVLRRRRAPTSTGCSATTGSGRPMDFGDSPDEAEFRLAAAGLARRPTTRACPRRRPTTSTGRAWPAWHQSLYDGGFFGMSWPADDRRPGPAERLRRDPRRGAGRRRRAAPAEPRLPGAGHPRARQRRHPAAVPARHRQRARPLVPGLQRARRRLRPRLAAHPGRPRRRRVRHHRPQGLDELLRRRRLVPGAGPHRPRRAQAQGHLGLRRADAPAGHRAATAADDQRHHQGVRRGHLRRRPGAGRQHDRRARARAGAWP